MNMAAGTGEPLTQSDVIIRWWAELGADSAGSEELESIANHLRERFGEGAMSPAAIARVLADEGVTLRHPEVLDYDTVLRERRLNSFPPEAFDFSTLERAILAVATLGRLQAEADKQRLAVLRSLVLRTQHDLKLIARSKLVNDDGRFLAEEAAMWLTVWLQNPGIFDEWLSLRRLSPEFLQKFSK